MLNWNELRITPDGKFLIIDVEVQNLDYFKDVYLESLQMNVYSKADDFIEAMPDSKSISLWEVEDVPRKRVRKYIDIDGISDNLIFVYAIANGEPTEDTPCGVKEQLLVGIVYNKALLYNNSIKAIKTIEDCTPNKELIDQILKIKMFDLSIAIGDYKTAIKCWNSMFKKQITTKVDCGCYGYQ